MAVWLAQRDATYGLGATPERVRAAVAELRRDYDANPRRFTDLPMVLDGVFVAVSASQTAEIWPLVGQVLKELRAATGPTAPPTVKQVLGGGGSPQPPPPAGMPERSNPALNRAALCNEDPNRPDFASRLGQLPAAPRAESGDGTRQSVLRRMRRLAAAGRSAVELREGRRAAGAVRTPV